MKSLPSLLKKIAGLRILVIGDVMLDRYIWGDATRISPEAPVPVIDVSRETWTAGGAANVALNLASLGAHVEDAHAVDDRARMEEMQRTRRALEVAPALGGAEEERHVVRMLEIALADDAAATMVAGNGIRHRRAVDAQDAHAAPRELHARGGAHGAGAEDDDLWMGIGHASPFGIRRGPTARNRASDQ